MEKYFLKKEFELKICGNCGYWINLTGHGICDKHQKGTGKLWYCLNWTSIEEVAKNGER